MHPPPSRGGCSVGSSMSSSPPSMAVQHSTNRAGITTYAQLADTKPEQLREALGRLSPSAKVEAWISQARELSASK